MRYLAFFFQGGIRLSKQSSVFTFFFMKEQCAHFDTGASTQTLKDEMFGM